MIIQGVTLSGVTVIDSESHITSDLVVNLTLASYSGSGTTWNDLEGSASATLTGSPSYNASTGFTFNGTTSQYARMPSISGVTDFNRTDDYTVEIWFKPSSGQPNNVGGSSLLEKWNSSNQSRYPYVFRYNESTQTLFTAVYDGTNNPSATVTGVNTGTWHQATGVFNFSSNSLTLYRNGVAGSTGSLAGVGTTSNTSTLGIAHRIIPGGGAQLMYKGDVGIIRIYGRALTASEVLQNFNADKNTFGL